MKDTNKTMPMIRFNGFFDAWEQRKSKEVCTISTGKGNTQDKVEEGKYPFYVRSATIERSNDFLYDQEAVLTVGDGVGTGKVFHYVNGKYNLHQRVYRLFNFNSNISAKYFYYYFSTNFYRRVMAMTAKTSVDSVRLEMIADMDIKFPISQEQNKIISFFDNLDDTIALHQRKLDALKRMKQGFLQQMFPVNGEKVPKARFADFDEDWEKSKLEELAEIRTGKAFSSKDFCSNGEYQVITNKDIQDEISTGDRINISQEKILNDYLLSGINILVTMDGVNIGKTGKYTNEKAVLAQRVGRINSDQPEFIYQIVQNDKFFLEMNKLSVGNAIKHISLKHISNYSFSAPTSKREQQKIGSFFTQLDDIIALHQKKLIKLTTIKKAYLQNLFI